MRIRGVVKWFNDSKGYGFAVSETGEDVFLHYTDIMGDGFKTLTEGQAITFLLASGSQGAKAIEIKKKGSEDAS